MSEEITPAQRQEIIELLQESNAKLVEVGSESAEQSFGLGCLLGGLVIVGITAVLFLAGVMNVIMAALVLVPGLLGLTGIVTLAASFARSHRYKETYRLLVGPEIERCRIRSSLSPDSLVKIAEEVLSEDAPLRFYLSSPNGPNTEEKN
jgi:hypothetical protein